MQVVLDVVRRRRTPGITPRRAQTGIGIYNGSFGRRHLRRKAHLERHHYRHDVSPAGMGCGLRAADMSANRLAGDNSIYTAPAIMPWAGATSTPPTWRVRGRAPTNIGVA